MVRKQKSIEEIKEEVKKFYEDKKGSLESSTSILIMDTGALIDIQKENKEEWLGKLKIKRCMEDILEYFEKYAIPIVTPATMNEVEIHSFVKINGHEKEISSCTYGFSKKCSVNFQDLYDRLESKKDQNRYDAWLFTRNNLRSLLMNKSMGEISIVDLDILENAYLFATTNLKDKKKSLVCVLTSDHYHVAEGINLIRKKFELENLGVVETRK
ncbi:MAG: hypothetical protein QW273_00190 [Candidatus Pacearchaeota archaeon]